VAIKQGDELEMADVRAEIEAGKPVKVKNLTTGKAFDAKYELTERQVQVMLAGGLLNFIKTQVGA
jgi:aconitate hydratase